MINYEDILEQNPWWLPPTPSGYGVTSPPSPEGFGAAGRGGIPEESALSRRTCFADIQAGLERPFVQVLLGLRRVGKSTVLRQLIADLLAKGTDPRHILYFSFDRYAVEKTPAALETVLKLYLERSLQAKLHEIDFRCYLFIDEIQYVDYWQDIVKRFYDQNKRLKFILTGSQSSKLRGKSKESLAGRLIEYHLQPLSFTEYGVITGRDPLAIPSVFDLKENEWLPVLQEFQHKYGAKIEAQMPIYLSYGQFPEVAAETDIKISYQYIRESVLGKILESDLTAHHKIEHAEAFKAMAYHLITNSGSLFELANIGADLGISKPTTEKYLGYLKDSTLVSILYGCTRSAVKKGRSLKKAYAASTCFISVINRYPPDFYEKVPEVFGKVVETYIWWRLSQRFEDLAFWRQRQDEVDFLVTESGRNRLPIEVKFGSRVRPEELRPLLAVMGRQKAQRGLVITRNKVDSLVIDGRRVDLVPFYLV
jgi:uncharacterized protein